MPLGAFAANDFDVTVQNGRAAFVGDHGGEDSAGAPPSMLPARLRTLERMLLGTTALTAAWSHWPRWRRVWVPYGKGPRLAMMQVPDGVMS
jgi:hypothetical protein